MQSSRSPTEQKSSIATRRLNLPRYSFEDDVSDSTIDATRHVITLPLASPTTTPTTRAGNDGDNMTPTPKSQPSPRRDSAGATIQPRKGEVGKFQQGVVDAGDRGLMARDEGRTTNVQHDASRATTSGVKPFVRLMGQQDEGESSTRSQEQLHQYRDRLARDLEQQQQSARSLHSSPILGDKMKRVSPILEEAGSGGSLLAAQSEAGSGQMTTSTESGNTIRGGMTPGFLVGTPSYPFPRMAPPTHLPSQMQRQWSGWSGGDTPQSSAGRSMPGFGVQDRVMSGASTPASNLDFNPKGSSPPPHNPDFPLPNLYELSLMLHAEPGLEAWWDSVVSIMTKTFRAERVTLSVPADATDVENVPWGQKATYNEHQEDELSMGYMARGSSAMPSSTGGDAQSEGTPYHDEAKLRPSRPNLLSRHSFTAFEENKGKDASPMASPSLGRRPSLLSRSKSYFPPGDKPTVAFSSLNKTALAAHDAAEGQPIAQWEAPLLGQREVKGRVLPVLQALDYEADPLIDYSGVNRVLERSKVVALTRSYPYLRDNPSDKAGLSKAPSKKGHGESGVPRIRKGRSESTSKSISQAKSPLRSSRLSGERKRPSGIISRLEEEEPRPRTPKYEEYEQAPPSPWSQSPAPSPAVRPDPKENPFFTDAMVDEESFNPTNDVSDYTSMPPPEAIGVDNSWTVLHIPLKHVLFSQTNQPFRLDSSAIEQKAHARNRSQMSNTEQRLGQDDFSGNDDGRKDKTFPIAILSILSPIIPYPTTLRHGLENLSMHLATSFSLCRHYSNLEMELAGLQRRRPNTAGFGALDVDGRPISMPAPLGGMRFLPAEDIVAQESMTGSMTSPSECSGISRSAAGSPSVTPSGDQASLGPFMDKRVMSSSPLPVAGDSYFSAGQKQGGSSQRADATSAAAKQRKRQPSSVESSPVESRRHSRLPSVKSSTQLERLANEKQSQGQDAQGPSSSSSNSTSEKTSPGTSKEASRDPETPGQTSEDVARLGQDITPTLKAPQHRHTLLHSYGADFNATFPSLPPSTTLGARTPLPSRSGSVSVASAKPQDMPLPPPSDKLKSLILDSLPTHVFVALPQDGEIVWVNSRYLTYRGLSVGDLVADPWGSIHPDDREDYLKAWSHSLRTGEQFGRKVRIRRFDGVYRLFMARAVASRDKRGVIHQFLGSYMDMHDQHVAEMRAQRQELLEASESKHKLLANSIPQIIFTATENEGVTFANEQWELYTGQSQDDGMGLGFMNFVHPDDIARCQFPMDGAPMTPVPEKREQKRSGEESESSDSTLTGKNLLRVNQPTPGEPSGRKGVQMVLSRNDSSSSGGSGYEGAQSADLLELAKKGVIKVATDSSGRLSYTTEVRLRSRSGEYRWHLVRCVEVDNLGIGNSGSQYFGSATDINDHKLLEAKLKDAMESKSRFLSNMSHEIRTPLIGISGMVSFLQETVLNEEQRDYTNTIQTSANSLLMIINDILDLSKVDAGMMKLKYEWFHTRSLIEDVNELLSTMAFAKRLELNYIVEEDVPAWVKGDKIRIRQVLLNVIGNAIKFTSEGEVFSRCRVYKGEDQGPLYNDIVLEFAIIDTGRGFTKEEADLIFKPFGQIDGSSTRQHGGSGLGLVISRQLVELHGGKMEGTAVPGKGSTFTFTARFPLPTDEDHPDLPATPPPMGMPDRPRDHSVGGMVTTTSMPGRPLFKSPSTEATTTTTASSTMRSRSSSTVSPPVDSDSIITSPTMQSSGSSDPSLRSGYSATTDRSTAASSVNVGLARFSEAARASGHDLSQMKLAMPSSGRSSPGTTPTAGPQHPASPAVGQSAEASSSVGSLRPPMYSILIICPQTHSREATKKHIEMTLPKDVPHRITVRSTAEEAMELLNGSEGPPSFTHIVINLVSAEEVVALVEKATEALPLADPTSTVAAGDKPPRGANILVLSDTVQRQRVVKLAAGEPWEALLGDSNTSSTSSISMANKPVSFIYKPVKPSRFAVIFDPDQQRDLSIDRNRSSAQRMLESQKASYLEIGRRMGNRGLRVLLVEDNPVNQKVLTKYLKKVGVTVEIASDGEDCTDMVFSKPRGYYSLILCDLHMPRKDGYQACREIRTWEQKQGGDGMPIIALSANVMSDVQEKCMAAGFSDYVTKPVDFIDLSRAMSKFF